MNLSFQTVTLDSAFPDREGRLVFRDGQLLAVVSCLSDIHEGLVGQWFVEAMFGNARDAQSRVFTTLDQFEAWLAEHDFGASLPANDASDG